MEPPQTHYVRSGHHDIAYQVTGSGPLDLVVAPPVISHLEFEWTEIPQYHRFYERLGERFRVIRFDKQGMGMSDRIGDQVPTVEERMDEIRAVMEAAESHRAAIMGLSEGGGLSILFCATYPERAVALVLFGATARMIKAPDFEFGVDPEFYDQAISSFEENWGTGQFWVAATDLSMAFRPEAMETGGRLERLSATPAAFAATMRMNAQFDVRPALYLVSVPVLVMHRRDELTPGIAHGRYLAEHLHGARFIEYPGAEHWPWLGDAERVVEDIEEFLTGQRVDHHLDVERVLATVMFTDIVDSTSHAVSLGDRRWKELLEHHDSVLKEQIGRFRGRFLKSTGDGGLATFDGPGRAIRCATALRSKMRGLGIDIRAGLHTGEVDLRGEDIGGIAVHIGARVAALAEAGEILVSSTVKDLVVGSGVEFDDRGAHILRGVPDSWHLFRVTSA